MVYFWRFFTSWIHITNLHVNDDLLLLQNNYDLVDNVWLDTMLMLIGETDPQLAAQVRLSVRCATPSPPPLYPPPYHTHPPPHSTRSGG